MIEILVNAGAQVGARDQLGMRPLHRASSRGIIEALVNAGAEVDAKDVARMTALHLNATRGNNEAFRALMEAGANPNIKDGSGCTVLHLIAGSGDLEAIALLLARGANVNAGNNALRTPLHLAPSRGDSRMLHALLKARADVNAKDMAGMTPLHLAARSGDVSKIKALVAAGADVNAEDKRGLTALEWASADGRRDAAQLLRKIRETHKDNAEARSDGSSAKEAGASLLATKAIDGFALNLYSRLDAGENNLVFSPLSAFSALAIAFAGARGETREEMRQTIGLIGLDVPVHTILGRLNRDLSSSISDEGGALYIANGLWVHNSPDHAIRKEVREALAAQCNSVIREADFRQSPEKVSQDINSWVENATRGKIGGLVSPTELGLSEKVLLLVNAVYFKSIWAMPFKKEDTREARFTALDGSTIMVPMMHNLDRIYRYMETETFQAVEVPYRGKDLSMVIFLPKKTGGLPQFEGSLTSNKLLTWLGELLRWPYGVEVYLPRFGIRSRTKLRPALEATGMTKAFISGEADFSGFFEKRRAKALDIRLFISRAVQEAWIEVNEEGTEAAAATILDFSIGMDERPKVFCADHPFMLIIYHKPTKCILFMGRVTRPQSRGPNGVAEED
jgi:serpin B